MFLESPRKLGNPQEPHMEVREYAKLYKDSNMSSGSKQGPWIGEMAILVNSKALGYKCP